MNQPESVLNNGGLTGEKVLLMSTDRRYDWGPTAPNDQEATQVWGEDKAA
jgi:hypothetical protein